MRCSELRFAAMVLASGSTACSSATPVTQSEPAARTAPAALSQAPTGSRTVDATAPTLKLGASEAWQWLRATLPEETAKLRPNESSANIDKLLTWAPGEVPTLVFDRACRPLTLTRSEQTLAGAVNVKTTVAGSTKTVHQDSIAFGFDITLVCGSDTNYERGPGGAWVESGRSATGCFTTVGHNISDVRDGQVWYAAEEVELKIGCAAQQKADERCTDGTTRTCSRCTAASVDARLKRSTVVVHGTRGSARGGPAPLVDCSTPCPADELSPMIEAASAALADTAFEQLGHEDHPTLFRDRAACTAYRQKHVIAADKIDAW